MTATTRLLLSGLAALSLTAQPYAQSLADAAKRAEEQRKAAGEASPAITNRNLPGGAGYAALLNEYVITQERYSSYLSAWLDIMKLRTARGSIDVYLAKAERDATSPFELQETYAGDRDIAKILNDCSLTPYSFVMADVAFNRAMEDGRLRKMDLETLSPARRANVRFVLARNEGMNWRAWQDRLRKDLDTARQYRPRK